MLCTFNKCQSEKMQININYKHSIKHFKTIPNHYFAEIKYLRRHNNKTFHSFRYSSIRGRDKYLIML
jgi:hypothetical protein